MKKRFSILLLVCQTTRLNSLVIYADNFIAHAAQVNCVSIGKTSHRFLATGGDDRKVNIWTLGNPSARVVSMPWLLCDSECTPLAVVYSISLYLFCHYEKNQFWVLNSQ